MIPSIVTGVGQSPQKNSGLIEGIQIMKFAVRALALGMFVAGASAAVLTPHSSTMVASHQAVVAATPIPTCGPSSCTGHGK